MAESGNEEHIILCKFDPLGGEPARGVTIEIDAEIAEEITSMEGLEVAEKFYGKHGS